MRFNHELLKDLRGKKKDMSRLDFVIDLKNKTGVSISPQSIPNWMKGLCCPSFNNVLAIAKYFDRSVTDFIKED